MANTILTPTAVSRAIAVVLHQESTFLARINRQFDAQTPDGRKGGGSYKIRMPNQYTVQTDGGALATQDTSEQSETLTINQPFTMGMSFTDADLALKIEDFSERIIRPAMKQMAATIDSFFVLDFANSIANMVDNDGNAISYKNIMDARRKLIENLAPPDDDNISLLLSPMHNVNYADATKGLFNPVGTISAQYKNGMVGPVAGVGWVGQSTFLTDLTTGTNAKGDTTYDVNGATEGGSGTVTVATGSGTFKKGEVVEFEGCNAVHPETKADLGYKKQFVVTEDYAGGAGSLKVVPAIGGATGLVTSGARQNVSGYPTNTGIVYKAGAGNAEKLNRSLYFHRDSYVVAFAELENPRNWGAWGDFAQVDNIGVRVWRQGDIINGRFTTRIDCLAGGKAIRPQTACRIHADGV